VLQPKVLYFVGTSLAALLACSLSVSARAGTPLEEARFAFERFIAAQNAHDGVTVESLLWDSPDFLWVSRGIQVRGRQTAMALYRSYYSGTWQVDADMNQFSAVALAPGVVQILVPITFTRGAPGQTAQKARYLISQSLVQDASGWHITSILPVADTQLRPEK
jgi:hypothetical protein